MNPVVVFPAGLKFTVEAFFTFMFTVTLVAYTATAMVMAISADQTVVAIANIFMTISFVFMMVGQHKPQSCWWKNQQPKLFLNLNTNFGSFLLLAPFELRRN